MTEIKAPRCRLCERPAHWSDKLGQFTLYCRSRACENPERLCQECGRNFLRGVDGSGTKYCSKECKIRGYRPHVSKSDRTHCEWCGLAATYHVRKGGLWPYLCADCLSPIKSVVQRLKDHKVPLSMVSSLIKNPNCPICGVHLLEKIPERRTGNLRSPLVVDHDHRCCPGEKSCGQCVRGFLCARCNSGIGLLGESWILAVGAANYLKAWEDQ